MDLKKMMRKNDVLFDALSSFDSLGELLSALGCTLDFWAAEHGVSAEELDSGLEYFANVAKGAHIVMGLPTEPYQKGLWEKA